MQIAIGADHAGFTMKEDLAAQIRKLGHDVLDLGAYRADSSDDYPDFAEAVGKAIIEGKAERGVLICGSGVGVSVAVNKIPGIPSKNFYGEIQWETEDAGFSTAVEGRYVSDVYANDTNTAVADAYGLFNWRMIFKQTLGALKVNEFVRVDNLLDEVYAGSVIVNEGSGRFYESGTPRSFMVGLSASYPF